MSMGLCARSAMLVVTSGMMGCASAQPVVVEAPIQPVTPKGQRPVCTYFLEITPPCDPEPEFHYDVVVTNRYRRKRSGGEAVLAQWDESSYLMNVQFLSAPGQEVELTVSGQCRSGESLEGSYACRTLDVPPAEVVPPITNRGAAHSSEEPPSDAGIWQPRVLAGPTQPLVSAAGRSVRGLVQVRCLIDVRGVPRNCELVKTQPHGVGEAVLKMIRSQLYTSAMYRGKAMPVRFMFRIRVR